MAYTAIYRKYRPKTFDKLIGQEHIVKTLINQIESGKIGHAYLFCGTRGTGKTSTARMFARAINCLHPVNGSPCGECAVCRALDSGSLDVVEIDAASNNGVNEIRDLREKVAYPPVNCRYKVYIIDEVHMLTPAAFNALLKTLEEPPEHAVFILATTESHKLPATILSRCMRFDFKLVSAERLAKLIGEIFDDLGRKYTPEAVTLIAKAGEGSIRDALSIADVCDSYAGGTLTYDDVLAVLGASDGAKVAALAQAVLGGRTGEIFERVNELAATGRSMGVLTKDVVSYMRDLLVVRTAKNANAVLCLPEERFREYERAAEGFEPRRILRAMEIFSAAEAELKYAAHPRTLFETAAIKAAKPETDYDLAALLSRVKALEDRIKEGVPAAPPQNVSTPRDAGVLPQNGSAPQDAAEKTDGAAVFEKPQGVAGGGLKGHTADEALGLITRGLRKNNELMLWAVLQGLKAEIEGDTLVIGAKDENNLKVVEKPENFAAIERQLKEHFPAASLKVKAETSAKSAEQFDNDVDEIRKIFGEDIVIVE